jgi:2-keto-4-pentenoate hydratase
MSAATNLDAIAAEAYSVLGTGRQIAPFSSRFSDFELKDAYRVTAKVRALREKAGEVARGRKIGFTNRTIWAEYDVFAPNWGTMYDRTVRNLADIGGVFSLAGLAEPRIEPEIVFGLARPPTSEMNDASLLATLDWVAHGFEIVQSPFANWKFSPADTVVANALHGALLIGPTFPVAGNADRWLNTLSAFEIDLKRNGAVMDHGRAANVLDGPLNALRHLVELLAAEHDNPPLAAGEIVTTGTLTRALPIAPGETWTTELFGVALPGLSVRLT